MERTDDGNIVPGSLKLPQGDIDCDTTLTLGLQLVEHPCVLEGALAQLGSFLKVTSVRSVYILKFKSLFENKTSMCKRRACGTVVRRQ